MKNSALILMAFTLLLLTSCNKEEDQLPPLCPDCNFTCIDDSNTDIINNNCDNNQTCSFTIHRDANLNLIDQAAMNWKSGDKDVFLFSIYTDPNPNIADEESTILLGFELPNGQASFSLDGSQLSEINLHSQRICFCAGIPFYKVEKGCLQGKQQTDDSWWVQGNLVITLWDDNEIDYHFEVLFQED